MSGMRTATLLAAVAVVVAGLAAPGVGADAMGVTDQEADDEPSMGTHVSAFMQTSTADVGEAVESEMFDVAFENADENRRAELVSDRTEALEQKAERVREEYDRLRERDDLPEAAYDARMASLAARLATLERAIDETEPRADAVGVGTDELDRLRRSAADLAGPEVAEVARSVAGIEPPRGPPEDVGNGPGPGVDDGPGVGDGPDTDVGNGSGPEDGDDADPSPPDRVGPDARGNESPDDLPAGSDAPRDESDDDDADDGSE